MNLEKKTHSGNVQQKTYSIKCANGGSIARDQSQNPISVQQSVVMGQCGLREFAIVTGTIHAPWYFRTTIQLS